MSELKGKFELTPAHLVNQCFQKFNYFEQKKA